MKQLGGHVTSCMAHALSILVRLGEELDGGKAGDVIPEQQRVIRFVIEGHGLVTLRFDCHGNTYSEAKSLWPSASSLATTHCR